MSSKEDRFWMDDPEWAALHEKQKGQPKAKLSRAQRKKLREAQFQAELKVQQAKAAQVPSPQAQAYINTGRPSARYSTPRQNAIPTSGHKLPPVAPATTPPKAGVKNVNVSLNLTLPRINIKKIKQVTGTKLSQITPVPVKQRLKKVSRKQYMIGAAATAVVVIVAIGLLALLSGQSDTSKKGQKGVLAEQTLKVDFKPLLPNGKVDQTTAHKAAKDGQGRTIYTFTDKVGSADLTVSEQPLPESFKANPDTELEKMAKDLYLTEVINQSNPKAYLGTSVKGPQTVIFTKNGLLVFIQAQTKLDKDQWSDYVTRLIP